MLHLLLLVSICQCLLPGATAGAGVGARSVFPRLSSLSSLLPLAPSQRVDLPLSSSWRDRNRNRDMDRDRRWSGDGGEWERTRLGLKYSLSKVKSLPDSLFVKRGFQVLGGPGRVLLQWGFDAKRLDLTSRWRSPGGGLGATVRGNSDDKITELSGKVMKRFGRSGKVQLGTDYSLMTKLFNFGTAVTMGNTMLKAKYDSNTKHTTLLARQHLSPRETIAPSINLNTGKLSCRWMKSYGGRTLSVCFSPGSPSERLISIAI